MHPLHLTALHLLGLAIFILLLIQTARASYWRGQCSGNNGHIRSICEDNREARQQRDRAIKDALEMREYLQRLHERALLASSEPELFNELYQANDLLRSLHAVVERDGADTNWAALAERLEQRLEAQRNMLSAAPAAS